MGTINYGTSNYITLGFRPYDRDDFLRDPGFLEDCSEYAGSMTPEEYADLLCFEYAQADYYNVEEILNHYYFEYFHVKQKSGYYEGSYIEIEPNFGWCYETYKDKAEAQKELTRLQKCLIECAGVGMVACWPSWRPDYADGYAATIVEIKRAIKDARAEISMTPTWYQLKIAGEV